MAKGDKRIEKIEGQLVNLENRVQKLESIFHLGSSILTTYKTVDPFSSITLTPIYPKAVKLVRRYDRVSASLLQRRLSIGYAAAARLIDLLEERGVVGPAIGSKPRIILPFKKQKSKK